MALINCPECNKEISDKASNCPNCGCPINNDKYHLYITDCGTKTSLWNGISSILNLDYGYEDMDNIVNNLPYKITECDSKEEASLISQKFEKYYVDIEIKDSVGCVATPTQRVVLCPKCNSDKIQLLNRKWSVLSGFATNKVNRVCVNCKYKF